MTAKADAISEYPLPNGMKIHATASGKRDLPFLFDEVFTSRSYEQEGVSLTGAKLVVDVGANIGMFAMRVKEVAPDAQVFCFEPAPSTYECLKRNLSKFHGTEAMQVAVSDRPGQLELTYFPRSPGNTTARPDLKLQEVPAFADAAANLSWLWRFDRWSTLGLALLYPFRRALLRKNLEGIFTEQRRFTCQATTLDRFLADRGLAQVDLLKVDVEGAEREVFAGLSDDSLLRVRQVVAEISPGYKQEFLPAFEQRLRHNGFTHVAALSIVPDSDPYTDGAPCTLHARR